MSDIMEATRLAKGGIYGNFENKEQLCVEVFAYLSGLTHDGATQAIHAETTAKGKLYALLDFYDTRLLRSNTGGCPILNFGTEVDDTNPMMKQKVSEAISRFKERFSNIIADGKKSNEFSADFDADLYALKAFTMIEGAVLISKVQNNRQHLHTIIDLLKKEIDLYLI